jgi:hypothetical protein
MRVLAAVRPRIGDAKADPCLRHTGSRTGGEHSASHSEAAQQRHDDLARFFAGSELELPEIELPIAVRRNRDPPRVWRNLAPGETSSLGLERSFERLLLVPLRSALHAEHSHFEFLHRLACDSVDETSTQGAGRRRGRRSRGSRYEGRWFRAGGLLLGRELSDPYAWDPGWQHERVTRGRLPMTEHRQGDAADDEKHESDNDDSPHHGSSNGWPSQSSNTRGWPLKRPI